MQKCPNCLAINEGSSQFCKKCGQKLNNSKSKSFRKFIITISVLFSIIIIGLLVYLVLTNYAENYLSSLFSKEQKTVLEDKIDEVIELSEDQARVTSIFGYPDEFVIVFDKSGEYSRAETWLFKEMEVSFTFLDGKYNTSDKVVTAKLENDNFDIKPEDFAITMSPDEINNLIGEIGIEEMDPETNLKVLTFGEGVITCTFDPDDSLMIVFRMRRVLPDEG